MSDDLPEVPGLYIGASEADFDGVPEPTAVVALLPDGRWIDAYDGQVASAGELRQGLPLLRLVPLTDEELRAVREVAGQIATALRLNAIARQRWGDPTQPELTQDLIDADTWRAIAEKTGAP